MAEILINGHRNTSTSSTGKNTKNRKRSLSAALLQSSLRKTKRSHSTAGTCSSRASTTALGSIRSALIYLRNIHLTTILMTSFQSSYIRASFIHHQSPLRTAWHLSLLSSRHLNCTIFTAPFPSSPKRTITSNRSSIRTARR